MCIVRVMTIPNVDNIYINAIFSARTVLFAVFKKII